MLFHTVWPAVDIIPYNSVAQSSLDASQGAAGNQNYMPVSSESTVAWNYGANFGGPSKATWTSGANSLTAGSVSLHPMCAHANALLAPCTRSATLLARATLLNTQEWQRRANKVTPWL
jgi:hypothetical protein